MELVEDILPGAEIDELFADLVDNVLDDMEVDGGDGRRRHIRRSGSVGGKEEERGGDEMGGEWQGGK